VAPLKGCLKRPKTFALPASRSGGDWKWLTNDRWKHGLEDVSGKHRAQGVDGTTFGFVVLRTKAAAIFLAGVVDALEKLQLPNDYANHALNGQMGIDIER
jgi:hypothetical protein